MPDYHEGMPAMTTPILYGSGRSQKEFLTPKTSGVNTRSTNFGYLGTPTMGRYVIPPPPPDGPSAVGTTFGYHLGGESPAPGSLTQYSSVQRYPFVVGTPATTIGDMSSTRRDLAAVSNPSNFYSAGGSVDRTNPSTRSATDVIDKFPVGSGSVTASSAGNLSNAGLYVIGYMDGATGYFAGGTVFPGDPGAIFSKYTHDKYPFATENISVLGPSLDPTITISGSMAAISDQAGYINAAPNSGPNDYIQKMPFANETFTALPTDQTETSKGGSGHQSSTNGYFAGTYGPPSPSIFGGPISTFPFASDTGAVVTIGRINDYAPRSTGFPSPRHAYHSGSSGPTNGFISGGQRFASGTGAVYFSTIISFPFASAAPITFGGEGELEATNRLGQGVQS